MRKNDSRNLAALPATLAAALPAALSATGSALAAAAALTLAPGLATTARADGPEPARTATAAPGATATGQRTARAAPPVTRAATQPVAQPAMRPAGEPARVELIYGAPVRIILPDKLSWSWTAVNNGPRTARNVRVTHDLGRRHKAGQVPRSCTARGSIVTCRIGTLAPGEAVRGTIAAVFVPGHDQRMDTSGRVSWDGPAGTGGTRTAEAGSTLDESTAARPSRQGSTVSPTRSAGSPNTASAPSTRSTPPRH